MSQKYGIIYVSEVYRDGVRSEEKVWERISHR